MSDTQYKLVFKGEILPGFQPNEVKKAFAKLTNRKESDIKPFFAGSAVVLKKADNKKDLYPIVKKCQLIGVKVDIHQPMLEAEIEAKTVDVTEKQATQEKQEINTQAFQLSEPEAHSKDAYREEKRKDHSRKEKWKYKINAFMEKGGSSTLKALAIAFLGIFLCFGLLRGAFLFLFPDLNQQYEDLGFFGNIYITFLQLTDPGNMAQDISSSAWYKVIAICAGLAGIILLSALIAVITTTLDHKLNQLKRGKSKVIEEHHTLIIGWNEQRIIEVLRELILANESEKYACIVILADKDKEEMDETLNLSLPERKTTKIVTRSGQVTALANLEIVSIERCTSVIILASCSDSDTIEDKIKSDAKVIQTILASTGQHPNHEDFNIVAEIFNDEYRAIIETTFPENVVSINTSDILAKLLVQTSRSVGLSVVYNEILSFDGCEMYFYKENWHQHSFGELAFYFEDGVPMGVLNKETGLNLNPSIDYRMQMDDSILILANDDSTIAFKNYLVADPQHDFKHAELKLTQKTESELIIGWNHKAPSIIKEFSDYVLPGSRITILLREMDKAIKDQVIALNDSIQNIDIKLAIVDIFNRQQLEQQKPFAYNNIIILAHTQAESAVHDTDSENLVTLLLLRSILKKENHKRSQTKIITEILDSQNYPLVAKAGVKDIIISNRLVSMVIAQVSQSKNIKAVYDDIFEEDGSEIYLKPARLYFETFPVRVSFAQLIAIAQRREEVCLGIKLFNSESDIEKNNGIELIPNKNKVFSLTQNDSLVVLSEDEL